MKKGEHHTPEARAHLGAVLRAAWAGQEARRAKTREHMRRLTQQRWAAWRKLPPAERERAYRSGAFGGRTG
jgi:hypothetical protein